MRLVALGIVGIVVLRAAGGALLVPLLQAMIAILPLTSIASLAPDARRRRGSFAANLLGVLILAVLSAGRL